MASDFGVKFEGFAAVRVKAIKEFSVVDTSDLKVFLKFELWCLKKGKIIDRVFRMI